MKALQKHIYEELGRCYDDPLRFVLWAFPWGEKPETSVAELPKPWSLKYPGCKYGPDKWACEFLEEVGKQVRARRFDGTKAVDPIRMAVSSGHGIGKSSLTSWLVCWILATRPNCKGVITANTANQLETKTWAEITKWLKRSLVSDMFDIMAKSIVSKESPEAWRVDAITCKEENSEAFAGLHAASSTAFYIFDEASNIPAAIYEVAEGGLTDGEPMMFLFGNPTRSSGRFFDCFHSKSRYWKTFKVDSRECQITNKEQIKKWEEEYGSDSDFFRVRVRGEFPNASSSQFIPTGDVQGAMQRSIPKGERSSVAIIGVDVARYGNDDTVIFFRFGKDGTMPYRRFNGLKTTEVVVKVKQAILDVRRLGYEHVFCFIDEGGVGGGPVDILQDDGYSEVHGVNFGWGADDPTKYRYKRDEMWGRMKEWLKSGILPEDDSLLADLISPEYEILPNGTIKLESKESMKKRGLHSPDIADALALTFSQLIAEYSFNNTRPQERPGMNRNDYNPFSVHMNRDDWGTIGKV